MKIEAAPSAIAVSVKPERSVPFIVWILIALALVALPLRILSYGYLPNDDALRHAAKAVSGKSWSEILLLRPEVTIDHNPGWHVILGGLHRLFGWDPRVLVQFSVVAMFLLFTAAPLPWLRRPEGWLWSLATVMLVFPYFADRALVGRPLFATMAITLVVLSLWNNGPISVPRIISTTALFALSTWVHGSWYLLLLIPTAFFLARQWKEALALAGCWAAGSVLGATLTSHPWQFLSQSTLIPLWALSGKAPREALAGEFQPMEQGQIPAFVLITAILGWRAYKKRRLTDVWRDPAFVLALLGLALGWRVVRFWLDWGIPALALWLARQLEDLISFEKIAWSRVVSTIAAGLILIGWVGADRNARWSQYAKLNCLDATRAEHSGWVPDAGGLLYAVDLSVFYQTFFTNPHGNWRYVMGFEPTFMRAEDLAVYRDLARSHSIRALAPWVQRMTPADRLVLQGPPQITPGIRELEWFYAAPNTWVGRTPRARS